MLFNSKFSKFGRGHNISAIMTDENQIEIYYFNKGVSKKVLKIEDKNFNLSSTNQTFPYNEVIPINNNFLVTRLDKSIGIICNE